MSGVVESETPDDFAGYRREVYDAAVVETWGGCIREEEPALGQLSDLDVAAGFGRLSGDQSHRRKDTFRPGHCDLCPGSSCNAAWVDGELLWGLGGQCRARTQAQYYMSPQQ